MTESSEPISGQSNGTPQKRRGIVHHVKHHASRFRDKLKTRQGVKSVLSTLTTIATIIPMIWILGAILCQVAIEVFDESLAIEPISVPSSVEALGYTPDVVAARLGDEILSIRSNAASLMKLQSIAVGKSAASMITPDSTGSVVVISSVLRFLHLSRRTYVTGEITAEENGYRLRLRVAGYGGIIGSGPEAKSSVEELFHDAAHDLMLETEPYIVGVLEYKADHLEVVEHIARDAIVSCRVRPNADMCAALAHNLLGAVHFKLGKKHEAETEVEFKEAEVEFENAVHLADLAMFHENRGEVFQAQAMNLIKRRLPAQQEFGAAILEYQKAISLDGNYESPHLHLAYTYKLQGDLDSALEAAQKASKINKYDIVPLVLAGRISSYLGQYETGMKAFDDATKIDANNDFIRHYRGLALLLEASTATDGQAAQLRQSACAEFVKRNKNIKWDDDWSERCAKAAGKPMSDIDVREVKRRLI